MAARQQAAVMRKVRFMVERIVSISQEADRILIAAVVKRHGVSEGPRFMSSLIYLAI